jgi:hypothetical protein
MRQPTPEQKAKAAERREKFRLIAKRVAEMSDTDKASMTNKKEADVPTTDCPKPETPGTDESRFLIGTVFDVSQTIEVQTS